MVGEVYSGTARKEAAFLQEIGCTVTYFDRPQKCEIQGEGQVSAVTCEGKTVAVDGVFGERTLEAVLRFQKRAGLPMTGRADPDTWEAIRTRWWELEGRTGPTRPVRLFPAEGTRVEEGTAREYLILPQTMFQVLSRQFLGIADVPADGVYTAAWADNVRWLQRAGGLPPTGTLDQPAWDALSRLYEVFVVRERERDGFDGGWG